MVFDNGKVTYAENEKSPGDVDVRPQPSLECIRRLTSIQVSGAEAVLAKL